MNNLFKLNFISNNSKKCIKSVNSITKLSKFFCSTETKNKLYIWRSSVNPGIRVDDYKNKFSLSSSPLKVDFFDDKNPVYVYCGPRHSAVIVENGDFLLLDLEIGEF